MELWVRSQDKTILTPISEKLQILANIDIPQEQYIVMYKGEELGIYETKERALEVLDEIQNFIERKDITGNRYYEDEIYKMPEE